MADENLNKLTQLAQIAHLFGGQDQLQQQDQQAKMTLAVHLLGLQQQTENEAAQRRLQELAITDNQQARKDTTGANVLDTTIHGLVSRGDVPLSTVAGTLRKAGHTELADTLDEVYDKQTTQKAAALMPAIVAAHAKGGDVYNNVLGTAKADPDVWAKIQPHLPSDTTATTSPGSLGASVGKFVRGGLMTTPLGSIPALTKAGYDVGHKLDQPGQVNDFWNALLNKQGK